MLRLPEKMWEVLSAMSLAVILPNRAGVWPASHGRAARLGRSAPLHPQVVKAFIAEEIH